MGILEDFSKRKAQELRNDIMSGETEQPSSESTDDPTNNLEYVDRNDQKKNHTNGPHGESTNKTASLDKSDVEKMISDAWDNGENSVSVMEMTQELQESLEKSGYSVYFAGKNWVIRWSDYETKLSRKNPFHVAQVKETGHDDGELSDQETAETGHIGGNHDMKESYNGGGRTPGKMDNSTSLPAHHDRENNAEKEQIV
jgi:hypothetical protein